jgi:hypothetical protein
MDNGEDVLYFSHVQLMCSMIYENCVNRGQSHISAFIFFYTTKSCVSLRFFMSFVHRVFVLHILFHFSHRREKSAVVMSSTCIIFFPSIFYVRYNQQCVHHIKQTLSPPTAVHFIYQQALLLRTRVYLRPSMQP